MTPRVITCAEDLPEYGCLPRGRQSALGAPAGGERAANALRGHDIGVFVAPPGVGKTVVGTYLVAERACSTLILVHRRPLLDQWVAQLLLFLGIEPKEIGQIGSGKKSGNGRLDGAVIQRLVRKGRAGE